MYAERQEYLKKIRELANEVKNVQRRKQPEESSLRGQDNGNCVEDPEQGHQQEERDKKCHDEYRLIKRLGKGAFGQIVLAERKSAGGSESRQEICTIKVVPKTRCGKAEKEVLIQAVGHPFLVQMLSFFETEQSCCYVLEYMEGGDLRSLFSRIGVFSEARTRFYAAEITLAVDFLHTCGIVHRDIKLENVLLGRDGHCKLCDFGVSKLGILNGVKTRTCIGTRVYMAPEIWQRVPYGPEVDWWSLGVTMFRMMVGCNPFNVFCLPVPYPSSLSENAVSILKGFLTEDPRCRLGANGDTGAILRHPFFETTDWGALLQKRVESPFKPHSTELPMMDPGAHEDTGDKRGNLFFRTTDLGAQLEEFLRPQSQLHCQPVNLNLPKMDPVPRGDAEDNRRSPSLKKRDRRTLPKDHMRQSFKEQTTVDDDFIVFMLISFGVILVLVLLHIVPFFFSPVD